MAIERKRLREAPDPETWLKGRDPAAFNKAMHFTAMLEDYARELGKADLATIIPNLDERQAARVRNGNSSSPIDTNSGKRSPRPPGLAFAAGTARGRNRAEIRYTRLLAMQARRGLTSTALAAPLQNGRPTKTCDLPSMGFANAKMTSCATSKRYAARLPRSPSLKRCSRRIPKTRRIE